jgi:outer membrane protein OmpA-like peptidoglycan-associated protein
LTKAGQALTKALATNSAGILIHELEPQQEYFVNVLKMEYGTQFTKFTTNGRRFRNDTIALTVNLCPSDDFEIPFGFDSSILSDVAVSTLDSVVEYFKSNRTYHVTLKAHADCRGSNEYNADLSVRRANTAKEYLESKIGKGRIDACVGVGETEPKFPCCNCNSKPNVTNPLTIAADNEACEGRPIEERCGEDKHFQNRYLTGKIIRQ